MAKLGRKQKHYSTTSGEIILGLQRLSDARWKVLETGFRFTEPNEAKAIEKFEALTDGPDQQCEKRWKDWDEHRDDNWWHFVRTFLLERPAWVAEKVGIPQLANLATMNLPKPSLKLTELLDLYKNVSEATDKSKSEVDDTFNWFIEETGAKTLADLTQEKLRDFRKVAVEKYEPSTVSFYFGQIRTVLNSAIRGGADVEQIEAVKLRMKVMYPPKNDKKNDPHPISVDDFHQLLNNVHQTKTPELWRAMLLMGLNAALYMEDLCSLRWDELDLTKRTYVSNRKKRGRCIRAAVLWSETVVAISALPRRGNSPYVFTSNRGTRYNRNTKINDYRDYRHKVGVPDVKWSHLRDGAYTAACQAQGVDEKFARLLAGHRSPGLQDKYVKRNPECVAPACAAVKEFYFGKVAKIAAA